MFPGVSEHKPKKYGAPGRLFATLYPSPITRSLTVAQVSVATSKQGTVRGIHYAAAPGQAKHVTCVSGAIWDVVVDLRRGSPTFGDWTAYLLNSSLNSLYVPVGFGHGYYASDDAIVLYLLSQPYDPDLEREINPLDPDLDIRWPVKPVLSPRDASAPLLRDAVDLPEWKP